MLLPYVAPVVRFWTKADKGRFGPGDGLSAFDPSATIHVTSSPANDALRKVVGRIVLGRCWSLYTAKTPTGQALGRERLERKPENRECLRQFGKMSD
jgi:hypothetical protein